MFFFIDVLIKIIEKIIFLLIMQKFAKNHDSRQKTWGTQLSWQIILDLWPPHYAVNSASKIVLDVKTV